MYMATSFENIAINKLLNNEVELIPDIGKKQFSGRNVKLYELIVGFYSSHSKLPNADELKAVINDKAPTNVRGPFCAMVDNITTTDINTSNDIVIKALNEAMVLRNVDTEIEKLLEYQRNKDAEGVKGILSNLLEDISVNNVSIDDFTDAMNQEDNTKIVPSGLGEEHDELIGGGYTGVTLIGAASGAGKSIALQQCSLECFKAGLNVLFVSLELSGKVAGNRAKAYLSGVNFSKINSGKLTEEEGVLVQTKLDEAFKGKDNVYRFTSNQVDATELINVIKVEKQVHDIDVVVIDYLGLVSPAKNDRGESWASLANMVKQLHRMTISEGIVIVTATQINMEGNKLENGVPKISTRGTKELLFSSSQFFFLQKDADAPDEDEFPVICYTMKNRIAQPKHVILQAKMGQMRLDSTGVII